MKTKIWYWLEPVVAGVISGLAAVGLLYLMHQASVLFIADTNERQLRSLTLAFWLATWWILVHLKKGDPFTVTKSLIYGGVSGLTAFYLFPKLAQIF